MPRGRLDAGREPLRATMVRVYRSRKNYLMSRGPAGGCKMDVRFGDLRCLVPILARASRNVA